MRVGVVGSGIGGLCSAVGLQRAGADVLVFEQATDLRPGGSGLSVFANGVRAMDALGVGDRFREIASAEVRELRGGQRRPDGSWLSTMPMDALAELRVVDRTDLHGMLEAELHDGTLVPGTVVTDARPDGTLVRRGADGRESCDRFDLIVAADGLRSTVRATWPDDPGVRYAGYSAWRGITEHAMDLRGEAGETWGVGHRFGMAPLADGRVYWFAVATMPAEQTFPDEAATLRERFGHWHDPIPALIDVTRADRIRRLPISELARRLGSFRRGRIVLLGDAAHAMTPNLGQGGGQAMEDAATLAVLLASAGSSSREAPDAMLTRYDTLRRPRSQLVAKRSRAVGRLAHVRGRAASGLRDFVVSRTPQRALRRRLAWLQDWEPPIR